MLEKIKIIVLTILLAPLYPFVVLYDLLTTTAEDRKTYKLQRYQETLDN